MQSINRTSFIEILSIIDLKKYRPGNIFLTVDNEVRIGDLGLTVKQNSNFKESASNKEINND